MEPAKSRSESQRPHDARFLEAAYRGHFAELLGHLRRKLGLGPPDPDDVAQATFVRLAASEDPRAIPNLRAWLLLTARNLIIDARRHQGVVDRMSGALEVMEDNRADLSAEDVLSSREELRRLADIVATLKPRERSAFMLHRVDGLTYVEIARRLGVSESGARALVARALERCHKGMRR